MTVGGRIKQYADKRGISLRELSKRADIPYTTLYSMVRSGAVRASHDKLAAIANALEISVNELIPDASIRVNSAPEMVELQQKVAAGQATEEEQQAWMQENLKGLRRMQNAVNHMLSELEQYDCVKEIARQSRLMKIFDQLNDNGQEKALDFLEVIAGNPKYKK